MANYCDNDIKIFATDVIKGRERRKEVMDVIFRKLNKMSKEGMYGFFEREENYRIEARNYDRIFATRSFEFMEVKRVANDEIFVHMSTSWMPITNLMSIITGIYPGVRVEMTYREPSTEFAGEFESFLNKKIIDNYMERDPENPSEYDQFLKQIEYL